MLTRILFSFIIQYTQMGNRFKIRVRTWKEMLYKYDWRDWVDFDPLNDAHPHFDGLGHILMQCSWIEDNKWKLIYEWDLLRSDNWKWDYHYEIYFDNISCCLKARQMYLKTRKCSTSKNLWNIGRDNRYYKMTVIWNIYENPEHIEYENNDNMKCMFCNHKLAEEDHKKYLRKLTIHTST